MGSRVSDQASGTSSDLGGRCGHKMPFKMPSVAFAGIREGNLRDLLVYKEIQPPQHRYFRGKNSGLIFGTQVSSQRVELQRKFRPETASEHRLRLQSGRQVVFRQFPRVPVFPMCRNEHIDCSPDACPRLAVRSTSHVVFAENYSY